MTSLVHAVFAPPPPRLARRCPAMAPYDALPACQHVAETSKITVQTAPRPPTLCSPVDDRPRVTRHHRSPLPTTATMRASWTVNEALESCESRLTVNGAVLGEFGRSELLEGGRARKAGEIVLLISPRLITTVVFTHTVP